jgi:hypothetical protein
MDIELAVPLSISQIEAANWLHRQLSHWQVTDNALHALHALQERFPEFDIDATLLKVVAINQLYGTKVYAVVKMAQHIAEVMLKASSMDDAGLVEELAALSGMNHISFASKFAHFFIDMERLPIYDSYAVKMVAYHLGQQGLIQDAEHPYKAFIENLNRLKQYALLSCTTRELDHYLWLAGLYRVWQANQEQQMDKDTLKKSRRHINTEVAELFEASPIEAAMLLTDSNRLALGVLST